MRLDPPLAESVPVRVAEWIAAESWRTDEWRDPALTVAWGIRAHVRGVWVEAFERAGSPCVELRARVSLALEHQRVYDALSPGDRAAFHRSVHAHGATGPLVCELEPAPPDEEQLRITLTRHLYPEALDRQRFMDAVRELRNVAGAVIRAAQAHLHEQHGVTA